MNRKPTDRLLRGELSQPRYVLSLPDIRAAEILTEQTLFQTADGDVVGRPGDIAVTAYGGERYPIPPAIFYGTYEVIGRAHNRLVARRLIHIRTTWEILSDDVEFDYGADRGVVSVARGGWVYQSDEGDFGAINPQVKHQGHVEVGLISDTHRDNWRQRFERASLFLISLPPLLTLLSLLSLRMPDQAAANGSSLVLGILETALLMFGVGLVVWMRTFKWGLKAAVSAGAGIARQFQLVVEVLGDRASAEFPQMALWRAAQTVSTQSSKAAPEQADTEKLADIRARLARTLSHIEQTLSDNRLMERVSTLAEAGVVTAVVVINLILAASSGMKEIELLSIWLPSLLGALHSYNYRKRSAGRTAVLEEFFQQLAFIKMQLQSAPAMREGGDAVIRREAVLRHLCKVIGEYCQEELRLALARRPEFPL